MTYYCKNNYCYVTWELRMAVNITTGTALGVCRDDILLDQQWDVFVAFGLNFFCLLEARASKEATSLSEIQGELWKCTPFRSPPSPAAKRQKTSSPINVRVQWHPFGHLTINFLWGGGKGRGWGQCHVLCVWAWPEQVKRGLRGILRNWAIKEFVSFVKLTLTPVLPLYNWSERRFK